MIGRRKVITLLGSAAVTWPSAGIAQQPKVPTIVHCRARSNRGRTCQTGLK
jgi:hypothetical protein